MQTRTLDLVASVVAGDAFSDHEIWDAAYAIVEDPEAPEADKLVAMAKMNELTGEDDPCTPEALADLLAELAEAK